MADAADASGSGRAADPINELAASIRQGKVILFVGAGVSMNLGLPSSWDMLVDEMARDLGIDPGEYRALGDHYALAEYYRIRKGGLGGLRDWMEAHWHPDTVSIEASRVHALICRLNFPLVYTTNYDRWLERAFDHHHVPYTKVNSVADLPRVENGRRQLIKFHGDIDDEASIVLDEAAYFERLEFETPLDIRLRADVLTRGVLFIGYALSDVNLRFLFYKLSKSWQHAAGKRGRPRCYIFSPQRNAVQEAIFAQWGIHMIAADDVDAPDPLLAFLERLDAAGGSTRP